MTNILVQNLTIHFIHNSQFTWSRFIVSPLLLIHFIFICFFVSSSMFVYGIFQNIFFIFTLHRVDGWPKIPCRRILNVCANAKCSLRGIEFHRHFISSDWFAGGFTVEPVWVGFFFKRFFFLNCFVFTKLLVFHWYGLESRREKQYLNYLLIQEKNILKFENLMKFFF